ncbi:alpha/beta hydrolase [Stieleria sp. ICT_E10.1]|uniref:alpha/beta hydrolase n=1 Tax=Stieleria sedimenti TaxID=2976331 RepID=UPI00217FDB78|nr:alpha/beta hydrolase [Stieleria sedimenti]MCS7468240.1 alpha/beta hydrolase [Stieleria sedimenti]
MLSDPIDPAPADPARLDVHCCHRIARDVVSHGLVPLGLILLALLSLSGCSGERGGQAMEQPEAQPEAIQQAPEIDPDITFAPEAPPTFGDRPAAIDQGDRKLADSAFESEPESSMAFSSERAPRSLAVPPPPPMAARVAESAPTGPFATLPAGATHDSDRAFATVAVYYATDRQRDSVALSAYNITGNRDALVLLGGSSVVFLALAGFSVLRRRSQAALGFSTFGVVSALAASAVLLSGTANIEKHGVTYSADRGTLVRGIAEVTVPDTHQRGMVERPSLLRFEIREDQQEHIVLTSAVELSDSEFERRLAETVALSPSQDLLVFIHGYNVDFQSAIRRTAQIAVDLPFEGVPVCYSWPSQGTLLGYTVDENNAAWTQTHLKQFLLDLAHQSGARSINVVAHSMGNRPTTGALVEIGWEQRQFDTEPSPLFDRVVLAAPDVDADRFRRDLAPALTSIAQHVTLYASSDDQALIASKQVHGYPRAGESGSDIVVVPGVETIDVSGIDLSLLGHSYYGDAPSMLQDLYQLVRNRLPATQRPQLVPRPLGTLTYWQLIGQPSVQQRFSAEPSSIK